MAHAGRPSIAELVVAGEPAAWAAAGFTVEGDVATVGTVAIRLAGPRAGRGIASWSLRGLQGSDLDGLLTDTSDAPPPAQPAPIHRNGVVGLDHVVAFSPDLDRTVRVLEAAGLDLRRIREGPTPAGAERQAFFRLGEAILELIEHPRGSAAKRSNDPARFYGLAFLVDDLDATAHGLGALLGEARDAVQPGRRIATVRGAAGLGLPVAFLSPAPAT